MNNDLLIRKDILLSKVFNYSLMLFLAKMIGKTVEFSERSKSMYHHMLSFFLYSESQTKLICPCIFSLKIFSLF